MTTLEHNGEIISTTRVTVPSRHRRELCLTISALLARVRQEAGCRTYRFYGEQGDQNSFLLIGEWETREAWAQHLKSDNFGVLLGSLKSLCEHPQVDFKLLSHVNGIEAITKARCEQFKEATPLFIT